MSLRDGVKFGGGSTWNYSFSSKVYYTKRKNNWEVSQNLHDIVVSKTKSLVKCKTNQTIIHTNDRSSAQAWVVRLNHYPLDKC